MKKLLRRRQRLSAQAPALEEIMRGSIVERHLRCGKKSCHCADGPGHPATYLCVTVAPGRTEQISISGSLVEQARRGVAAYARWWAVGEEVSRINRQLLRLQRDRTRQMGKRRRG
jgi:hypothetical protein